MKRIDLDQSGSIDYSEFTMATMDTSTLLTEERIKAAFDSFDVSKTGTINVEDLKVIFEGLETRKWSDGVYQTLLDEVDLNKDGVIDLEEFTTMAKARFG
jgi:calcium-dependent protein kinase